MGGCALLGFFVGLMCFPPLLLWCFFFFLTDDSFVYKGLQMPLLIENNYNSVKCHLRQKK